MFQGFKEQRFKVSEFQGFEDEMAASAEYPEISTQYPVLSTQLGQKDTHKLVIPFMCAAADPAAKWWERLRGNPKRAGEISQAAFLLKAEMMGRHLALPWGDSERWDFAVWSEDGRRVYRVQVKGTGRLHRGGYEVQPVHSTRNGGKKRYTKKDVDVIAAHVQPLDAWYLIPIEKVGTAKSMRLHPEGSGKRRGKTWEKWLGAWEVLG